MPVISAQNAHEKEKIKIELDQELLREVKEYMQFAGIHDISHFFSEAAHFVFSKDRDWKKYKKQTA